jgi:hypothetical protein
MKKLLFCLALLATVVPVAVAEEAPEGCGWVREVCANSCREPLVNCMYVNEDDTGICSDQYWACVDECSSDFWCAYRAV